MWKMIFVKADKWSAVTDGNELNIPSTEAAVPKVIIKYKIHSPTSTLTSPLTKYYNKLTANYSRNYTFYVSNFFLFCTPQRLWHRWDYFYINNIGNLTWPKVCRVLLIVLNLISKCNFFFSNSRELCFQFCNPL